MENNLANKKFDFIGVYMKSEDDFDTTLKYFASAIKKFTGLPVSMVNKNSFITVNKELYTFITLDNKIKENIFKQVFIDKDINTEDIERIIKPTLIDKNNIERF